MRFTARLLAVLALSLSLALTGAGCGGGSRTFDVRGTQRDPGADARVQVERIEGGNHLITISVTNLTPPDRLGSGNSTFLVWVRQEGGSTALGSQLAYQPDSRTGRATLTTPATHFTLMITAERNAQAASPSEFVVFQQEISM
jgi:hypothetical protein